MRRIREMTSTGGLAIGHTLPHKPKNGKYRLKDFLINAVALSPGKAISDPRVITLALALRKKYKSNEQRNSDSDRSISRYPSSLERSPD